MSFLYIIIANSYVNYCVYIAPPHGDLENVYVYDDTVYSVDLDVFYINAKTVRM